MSAVIDLTSFGLFVFYTVHLLYGDLSGPTAVLYSILLGVQLRSAVADAAPLTGGLLEPTSDRVRRR